MPGRLGQPTIKVLFGLCTICFLIVLPAETVHAEPENPPPALAPAPRENVERGGEHSGSGRLLSEIRLGLLSHEFRIFHGKQEGGADINVEALLSTPFPSVLKTLWSPRPHIGASINTRGETSQLYAGLTWEFGLWRSFFADASFGFAIHDGALTSSRPDGKELGTRVLFRESLALGIRILGRHGVSLYVDHCSNAGLSDKNAGLSDVGLRYGYRF